MKKCVQIDTQALLKLKHGFTSRREILSSWNGEDCCKSKGILCNNLNGHVTTMDLASTISYYSASLGEHVKDSDTPECSDNQPLVASVPPVVRKTSWLSCCGLFDVLSGSNR
ncbi:hypothetical protein JHK87_035270 [Glycine soja]|nr:hypothetical protein JHK87_035270 [Glycine soja]